MVDIRLIKKLAEDYDKKFVRVFNYDETHARLCSLVDKYGVQAVSIATGLSEATVNQHYRNKLGTAMIANSKLDKADAVFASYESKV